MSDLVEFLGRTVSVPPGDGWTQLTETTRARHDSDHAVEVTVRHGVAYWSITPADPVTVETITTVLERCTINLATGDHSTTIERPESI